LNSKIIQNNFKGSFFFLASFYNQHVVTHPGLWHFEEADGLGDQYHACVQVEGSTNTKAAITVGKGWL
jgi:hypothetical protein